MPRQYKDREPISNDIELLVFRVLGKFASILLRLGLDAPRAESLLRCAIVLEAANSARRPGSRITQSQVALLAGVSRLDVRKILESQRQAPSRRKSNSQSRIHRILTAWRNDPEFSNGRGRPKQLTFTGEGNQFAKLVLKYGRDITVRTLRDDLTRNNLVATRKGRLILNDRSASVNTGTAAALADLSFLSNQLSQFDFGSVRRTYVTRNLTLSTSDAKLLKLMQRKSVAKLETALNSLESLKQTAALSKENRVQGRHRLRIVTVFSSETDRDNSRKG